MIKKFFEKSFGGALPTVYLFSPRDARNIVVANQSAITLFLVKVIGTMEATLPLKLVYSASCTLDLKLLAFRRFAL